VPPDIHLVERCNDLVGELRAVGAVAGVALIR
jgi:hypothetical protein